MVGMRVETVEKNRSCGEQLANASGSAKKGRTHTIAGWSPPIFVHEPLKSLSKILNNVLPDIDHLNLGSFILHLDIPLHWGVRGRGFGLGNDFALSYRLQWESRDCCETSGERSRCWWCCRRRWFGSWLGRVDGV
jgi:hypothetical protein